VLIPADVKEINVRIENARLGKVWFDDVKIVKGNTSQTVIVEESNYYPFGLKHKGYNNVVSSNGNSVAQKFGFGGKELSEELGLQWHDFSARNYDASLGRWFVVDPKADDVMQIDITPYNYSWNNPISVADPDGECPWCVWGAVIGAALEYGTQVTTNIVNGQSIGDALTDVDGGKIVISALTGAATGGLSSLKAVDASVKVYKAIATTSVVVAGNAANQYKDGNKTVDPVDTAVEVITDKIPIPIKFKVKTPSASAIKKADIQLNKAKSKRSNSRTSKATRQKAVKAAKKNTTDLSNKVETSKKVQKVIDGAVDNAVKEYPKDKVKKKNSRTDGM